MQWSPAAMPPPALAAAASAAEGPRIKKRAGLPKLLHKLFIKVLRLRPSPTTAFEECYGYYPRMRSYDEEYCYLYSYGGGVGSSWAGVLSSIPEEEVDDDSSEEGGTPGGVVAPAAVLRTAKSEGFVVGPPEAATLVHVEVLV